MDIGLSVLCFSFLLAITRIVVWVQKAPLINYTLVDINLSIESIANAPAFTFMWKGKTIDTDMHVGTSAQYWRGVLPNVVSEADDEIKTLSMQYGVAALVSSITIAKKVVNHEERIKQLEKENEYLREEISRLKIA